MKRREFLLASAAGASVPAALVASHEASPHRLLYQRWKALFDEITGDEDDRDDLCVQLAEVEYQICSIPATDADGIVAQLEFARDAFGDFWVGNYVNGNDTKLLGNMIASASTL